MKKLIAYVDGSFNVKTKEIGAGIVFIDASTGKVIHETSKKVKNTNVTALRNVAGELSATMRAVLFAEYYNYDSITIYYDYNGIAKWANHEWKAKNVYTQAYEQFMIKHSSKIHIEFQKVNAHTGDIYNNMADVLAKKACGIKEV